MKKRIIIIFILLATCCMLDAQDASFSQYYASPLYVNPAQGGFSHAPRFALQYRDQQPFFNRAFVTYLATFDLYVGPLQGALGVVLQRDVLAKGLLVNQSALFCYNYRTNINKINISIGVGAGVLQSKINSSQALLNDQVNLPYGFENAAGTILATTELYASSQLKPDASFGVMAYAKRAFVGVSAKHLLPLAWSAQGNNILLPIKYSFNAGYEFNLQPRGTITLTPNVLVSSQGPFTQCNIGAHLIADKYSIGAYYRNVLENSDAAILTVGYTLGLVKASYSYDFGLKGAGRFYTGAHELCFVLQIEESAWGKRQRRIKKSASCPTFLK